MPQHYGFRFSDDLAEKLNSYADRHKLSRSEALMQLLISALENAPVKPVELVQRTEQIQEIVEIKTAYLANAMNEVKHSLESEIETLKTKTIALENMTVEPVLLVQQAEQVQELIATAMNEVKHTLDCKIEALKAKLEGLETRLGRNEVTPR